MAAKTLVASPIGLVRIRESGFYLEIHQAHRPALNGLEGFSHALVLWWAHLCDDTAARSIVECAQPYRHSPARLGIFATRSPARPNPIGLTPVAILGIDHQSGIIHIPYIDAEDGTPIIDVKPYHPSVDRIRDVKVPEWCSHWPKWYEDSASFDWASEFVNAR